MLWGEKRGNKKGQLSPGVQPRTPLAWTASALPLSHDSLTATNPPKSSTCPAQVVLIASVHTWQPFSMCRQNPIRGWLENSAKNPCWMVLFTLDALSILLMLVIKLIYLDVMRQKVKWMTYTVTGSQTQDMSGLSCHWTTTAGQPPIPKILYMFCTGGTESHT